MSVVYASIFSIYAQYTYRYLEICISKPFSVCYVCSRCEYIVPVLASALSDALP